MVHEKLLYFCLNLLSGLVGFFCLLGFFGSGFFLVAASLFCFDLVNEHISFPVKKWVSSAAL